MTRLGEALFTLLALILAVALPRVVIEIVEDAARYGPARALDSILPLTVCAMVPLLWVRWLLRRIARRRWLQRFADDQCPYCGYDLRASWICCPECGRLIPLGLGDD